MFDTLNGNKTNIIKYATESANHGNYSQHKVHEINNSYKYTWVVNYLITAP